MHFQPTDKIRHKLREVVSQRLTSSTDTTIFETTLIRGGMYCGRRFSLLGFSVIYFFEEEQIKVYTPSGELERTCTLSDFLAAPTQLQRAA
jgi:hypothetical protein